VNYNPATAYATTGEWIEIVNTSSRTVPLDGWTVSFNSSNHTIPMGTNLTLPANGVLLLAQSGDPLQNDGLPTPDYVYGTGFALPNTSGNVRLLWNGIEYNRAAWTTTSGGALGKSVQLDPYTADHRPTNVNPTCPGTGTYGTAAPQQIGTPGVAQQRCFPYAMERLAAGAFESIATTGQKLNTASQFNAFAVQVTAGTPTLPKIKWGVKSYDLITVTDNGFLALRDSAVETAFNCSGNSTCYNARKTAPSTAQPNRIIAPYWSNLRAGNFSYTGMFLERKDPDIAVAGDEYTIVSWEGWFSEYYPNGGYEQNFQVKFFDTGDIEFHFGTMIGSAYSQGYYTASWLESETGLTVLRNNIDSYGGVYTYDGPGIWPDSGVRFRYLP
jgi:hypothetical protein